MKTFLKILFYLFSIFIFLILGFLLGKEAAYYEIKKDGGALIENLNTQIKKIFLGEQQISQEEISYKKFVIIGNFSIDSEGKLITTIKNIGNKSLKEVELTIIYKDKNGYSISEEKIKPVNEYNFILNIGPLKPNFVKDIEYTLTQAPREWSGNINLEVSKVYFV